jgi:56kDa selenium binding protein (SBP56)
MRCPFPLIIGIAIGACHAGAPAPDQQPSAATSSFLFVWAGDADRRQSDFLAVIDVDPRSPTYASVVATLPVGVNSTRPHHTEHEMSADGILWANGFDSTLTFRFDLRDPRRPRLLEAARAPERFSHPHSYARLPNGNVLATFQRRSGGTHETGGLVEFDPDGRVLRSADAAVPAIDTGVRPYSLLVLPEIDRVVSTATDMHLDTRSRAVQVWRLSDLALLHTIVLPPGPRGDENAMTAEPRLLADGRTVLVNTFTCGLYRVHGLSGDTPSAEWVYSTPWTKSPYCAVPVVAGSFWLQTNGPEHAVVSLDVSDPDRPREVSRLTLAPNEIPHWLALEPNRGRVVITGYRDIESRVLLAHLDRGTGALHLETTFTTPGANRPGVDFAREQWPHGRTGRAIPHGAVFSRP